MGIQENQSHYEKLGAALRSMIKGFDPKGPPDKLRQEIERILDLAAEIGKPLQEDAEALKKEFARLLKKKGDPRLAERFLQQALRLEQETREI